MPQLADWNTVPGHEGIPIRGYLPDTIYYDPTTDPDYNAFQIYVSSEESAWQFGTITKTGDPLVWTLYDCDANLLDEQTGSNPTFDLSVAEGIKTIALHTDDDFSSITVIASTKTDIYGLNLTALTELATLTLAQDSILESILLPSSTTLTTLSCSASLLHSLTVSQLINLTTLTCNNNQITELIIDLAVALITIDCNDNSLTSDAIDALLIMLDSMGAEDGTLNYSDQFNGATHTVASQAARLSLIDKGWTLIDQYVPIPM